MLSAARHVSVPASRCPVLTGAWRNTLLPAWVSVSSWGHIIDAACLCSLVLETARGVAESSPSLQAPSGTLPRVRGSRPCVGFTRRTPIWAPPVLVTSFYVQLLLLGVISSRGAYTVKNVSGPLFGLVFHFMWLSSSPLCCYYVFRYHLKAQLA